MQRSLAPTLLVLAVLAPVAVAQSERPPERRLAVLFLGDRGHHEPWRRAHEVLPEMAARGIDLFYRESLDWLARERLAPFDALLVYANHETIAPEQEAALLEFVAGGKGLVALHCASYCFLDSDAWVELVGARFLRHGAGEVVTHRPLPEHPILRGLEPLASWDETYVHERHATDRVVLELRPDPAGDEPWTWTRTHGAGRVFYTAWGHDLRTWSRPGFHELLARGIRWAAGSDEPALVPPPPPFELLESEHPIPEYATDGSGVRAGARPMQAPLGPEASLARAVTDPRLEARLFAAEPLVAKPLAIAWDERGRAFVAETVDYPNDLRPEGAGRDRIVMLVDGDGDGRADARSLFAEGLSIPTGLVWANGGLIVVQAPHTLFLRDGDGDGLAEERRVLFSGWSTADTHAGPSNLRVGFDGWIWGTVGYAGFRGTVGGREHAFRQGIFRFRPDGSELEHLRSTTNNTWGLGFSEEGLVFASTANGNPSVHLAIPARYHEPLSGWSASALATIAERLEMHPITRRVRQVDYHGKLTAAAGHALYTARSFPRDFWNRAAFVAEPTGHLVQRYDLEPEDSGFVARDRWSLVASDDEWCAPVAAEVGPDGAVWVLDWYAFIVQHNPTPPGFQTGRGNAYVTPLRDKTHGRIWRLVPRGAELEPPLDLAAAEGAALVEALGHSNLFWRLTAQRLLVEREERALVPALVAALRGRELDELGLDPRALHALHALAGLGALAQPEAEVEEALVEALRHPAASVRRAALELLPREAWARDLIVSGGALADPHAQVRLAALLALAEMPPSRIAGRALLAVLEADAQDRWIPDAATAAAARHAAGFLEAVLASRRLRAPQEGAPAAAGEPARNLLANASFERVEDGAPLGWRVRHYSGEAEHRIDAAGRNGGRALRIDSHAGADTSWHARARLEPHTSYRLSGWIRTEGVEGGSGMGALLNVHELQGEERALTRAVHGTSNWTRVELVFDSGGRREVTINCLLGGWGRSRGSAWWDDLVLERAGAELLPGRVGAAVERVTRHYASQAPRDTIVSTVLALRGLPDALAALFAGALSEGWPAGVAYELAPADRAVLAALLEESGTLARASLHELLARWGAGAAFAPDLDALLAELRAALADPAAGAAGRVAAAERLVSLADDAASARAILEPLAPAVEPELAAGLVEALALGRRPETGALLLDAWERLSPAAQRAAVRVLARRDPWTRALLERVGAGALPASVVDAATWSQLEQHPDAELAALARRARGGAPSADGAELLRRFGAAAQRQGDAERGRALYDEHCARCHVLAGRGERVGPELDGIGARPRAELLLAILDPNASVEANWQMWTARTRGGELFAGRLVGETRSSIELLESSGQTRVLAREELELVVPSALSLMPSGFESLGVEGLADLLAYLADL